MYIYLDDSGNIDSTDGKLYVWAGFSIQSGYKKLGESLDEVFSKFPNSKDYPEKKALDATAEEMDEVFNCLMTFGSLRICYVVIDKTMVTSNQKTFSQAKSKSKEQSENYFLSKVIKRLAYPYVDSTSNTAIVTIDGSPQRSDESALRLHEYLSLRINLPEWNTNYSWNNFKISYDSSPNHRLLQAADFIANMILEYYKSVHYGSKYDHRQVYRYMNHYSILKPKIIHKLYRFPNTTVF
ncbi:hypothetical protein FHS16_002204 [Paenibacillus endophyticus]|uniref:DUF3800 domain-containing protein n=1 Tax=Paenibacillus endophyticus TaxID=1294268 RepID=A0A7W5C6T9_9BACL|nr:DUF3800 domain-containing protein [Paenibacillus endophyticus]MBB3152158.1 hypothetical protein [Paenibacillus endophyticus]